MKYSSARVKLTFLDGTFEHLSFDHYDNARDFAQSLYDDGDEYEGKVVTRINVQVYDSDEQYGGWWTIDYFGR